jgi:hypothetical protein
VTDLGCPNCCAVLDGSAELTPGRGRFAAPPKPPSPGDVAICCYCNSMLVWQADGSLRNVTAAEWQIVADQMVSLGLRSLIPRKPPHSA